MDLYQQYIHISRYSRWRDDLQRRETWKETVQRYIDYFDQRTEHNHTDILNGKVRDAILNLKVMPSMRALMTAGEALERENLAGFNCSYLAINTKRSFAEALYILMCGTGVGFSCERQEITRLPAVPDALTPTEDIIAVADSKEGWAKAYHALLGFLWNGSIPKVDYSQVRAAGERLKIFGGRASGPAPLKRLFIFTVDTFKHAEGRKLNSLEVHDLMCMIGEIVVVGGVRRSALISLSNLSDQRMRDAKAGQWWTDNPQRGLANNSVAYTEKPSSEIFMEEWLSLVKSKSGERGIFNRVAAQKQAAKWGRRSEEHSYGCNPCCFTGDMRLLTRDGYNRFDSLLDKPVSVVSSDGSVAQGKVWSSGVKDIVKVNFHPFTGREPISCTPDHVFQLNDGTECEAADLTGKRVKVYVDYESVEYSKEQILAGFMLGDANLNRLNSDAHLGLEVFFHESDCDVAELFNQSTGTWYSREAADIAARFNLPTVNIGERGMPDNMGLLKGLFSANGCVVKRGRVALKSIDLVQLEMVSKMIETFGIQSYITTNEPKLVKFKNGEYECKRSYDLNIAKFSSIVLFAEKIGFVQRYKMQSLIEMIERKSPFVCSVQDAGTAEVYDFTEPKNHWGVVEGVVVHNSEIILRDKQLCNLSEVIVREDDDIHTLMEKVEVATILGTLQATMTKFGFVSEAWSRNTAEEALLGVSLTGIMDNAIMSGGAVPPGHPDLADTLNQLRDHARAVNEEWAEKLGINVSTSITCVKPSGTVSQLCNTASGIHARHNHRYIRTVRVDKKDPLYHFMKDKGFYTEDDVMRPDSTAVVSFAIEAPKSSITRDEVSALEAAELWLTYQREWCEHKPSVTITVKDEEWVEVGAWVYKHFDEVSGISFLPHTDHTYQQAPYQDMTSEEFDQWQMDNPVPEVDWTELSEFEKTDNTVAMQTLACNAGNCEI